ncbi:MAG: MarR family transcriptional regulator [Anaerolineales bacterium]|jgi:DNA-binding MarR family transcriptional regulator
MSSRSVSQPVEGSLPLRNYHLIHELFVLLEAHDRQILGHYGLIGSQYRLLMNLDRDPGLRLTQLSERLLLSKSTITRIVDQLEDMNWVARIRDPRDRRAQSVVLTQLGQQKRAAISRAHMLSLAERFRCIPAGEMEQLISLLNKMTSGLSNATPDCDDPSPSGAMLGQVQSKEVQSQTS